MKIKFLFATLMSSIVLSALAQDFKPDFTCSSRVTGTTYLIYYKKFTEVRYVHANGAEETFNSMIGFDIEELDTRPKTETFRFYDEANRTVAAIRKQGFATIFTGNNDQARCEASR
ncbi:MAG TPA: hypothetical protein VNJ01_08345 [Bacteriovoracaceae bacterium]|nr:hypothetical protein [Bacteriovoracaceae bacterium]